MGDARQTLRVDLRGTESYEALFSAFRLAEIALRRIRDDESGDLLAISVATAALDEMAAIAERIDPPHTNVPRGTPAGGPDAG